uniref:NADH-ubiquinone oxidoreductase chain 1 n=1 Tax=Eurydice pulchra TaxID=155694 RepID=E3SX90_EURPU|nr:NADH dehydrogenase subunit 1 [Eurydice pulchra]
MSIPITVKLLFLLILVLLAVAFFTLYKRKVLGYSQIRKGPNKLGIKGVLQPFSDAVKLFTNEPVFLNSSNMYLFALSPALGLSIALALWISHPSVLGLSEVHLGVIYVLCCLSLGVYPTLGAGWASNSKYSLLGGLRAVAQTISYEVSLALTLLSPCVLVASYNLDILGAGGPWFLALCLPLALVWIITSLAETNRTPFDFAEGESELVSGFNTEYSAGTFAMFFLAEYGSILFMSALFAIMVLGGGLSLALKTMAIAFAFIWVRGTLPRLRYDKLMALAWKAFLPLSLAYLVYHLGLKAWLLEI